MRLTGPQQGYLALAVFVAFAILPLRAFVALMILLGGAVLTRPDKRCGMDPEWGEIAAVETAGRWPQARGRGPAADARSGGRETWHGQNTTQAEKGGKGAMWDLKTAHSVSATAPLRLPLCALPSNSSSAQRLCALDLRSPTPLPHPTPPHSAFPRDEAFRYLEGMIKAAHERMDEDEAAALQRKPGVFGRFMKRITEKAQFAGASRLRLPSATSRSPTVAKEPLFQRRLFNRRRPLPTTTTTAVLRSMMRVRVLDYGVLKLALVSVADGTDAPEDDDSAIVYLGLFGHWINGDLLVRTVMRNVGMPLDDDAGPART